MMFGKKEPKSLDYALAPLSRMIGDLRDVIRENEELVIKKKKELEAINARIAKANEDIASAERVAQNMEQFAEGAIN